MHKTDKLAFIKIKNICSVKTLLREQKDKPQTGRIFPKDTSNKGVSSKELLKHNYKTSDFKKVQTTGM